MPTEMLLKILEGVKNAGTPGTGFKRVSVMGVVPGERGLPPTICIKLLKEPPRQDEKRATAVRRMYADTQRLDAFVAKLKSVLTQQRGSLLSYTAVKKDFDGATLIFQQTARERAGLSNEDLAEAVEKLKKQFEEAGLTLEFTPEQKKQS
ncbi:MAG: hypothetical protein QW343_01930 [Candidatus Norongarragalinales archaeon]